MSRWQKVMSDELHPGEIILLKKNNTKQSNAVATDNSNP